MDTYLIVCLGLIALGILLIVDSQDKELEGILEWMFGIVLIIAIPFVLWGGGYFNYEPFPGKWRIHKEEYGISISNGECIVPIKNYEQVEKILKDSTKTIEVEINKEVFGSPLYRVKTK